MAATSEWEFIFPLCSLNLNFAFKFGSETGHVIGSASLRGWAQKYQTKHGLISLGLFTCLFCFILDFERE